MYNIFEEAQKISCFLHVNAIKLALLEVALDEGGIDGKIRPDTTFEESDFRSNHFRGDREQQVYERVQNVAPDLDPA
jgi:hypothetical protein